jgi:hypothetical protein
MDFFTKKVSLCIFVLERKKIPVLENQATLIDPKVYYGNLPFFRLSPETISRMSRCARMSRQTFLWKIQVEYWNNELGRWDILLQSGFPTSVVPPKHSNCLKLNKPLRTSKIKIKILEHSENIFMVNFLIPKLFKDIDFGIECSVVKTENNLDLD